MNGRFKLVIGILVLVSTIGTVAASPAELNIFPQRSSTEINSFTSYEVTVTNDGPVADVYYMSSPSSEVTLAPTRVPENGVLEPGDSRDVQVWYNPGPEKEAGVYSFTVFATSKATGDRYSVEGTAEVIKDHEVDLQVIPDSRTACLGEKATYNVEVTNNGIQKEEFELTTRYGELSQSMVSLEENETQEVTLTASSTKPAQENFNVIAASTSSYAQDIENVEFKSEICYASEVSMTPENQDVAAKTEAEFDVTVKNTGTKQDVFALKSNMGELEEVNLSIDGKSSKTTTLKVAPGELGQKTLEVTADSAVTSSDAATMNVYNGMDSSVGFEKDSYNACENEEVKLEPEITNTGEAEETFNLSTSLGELDETSLELNPNESETVDLEIDTGDMDTGTRTVSVTSKAVSFGEPSTTSSTGLTVENCWDLNMRVVPKIQSAGKNRSVIYEVFLENTGTKENTYELSQDGPGWVSLKPEELTVAPGNTAKAFIYAGIPFGKDKAEIEIQASAVGNEINRSETVTLLVGKEVKDAIRSEDGGGLLTALFSGRIPELKLPETDLGRAALSIVIGLLITAVILYREW